MPPAPAPQILDTVGLSCPLPVLKARKALAALPSGALLEVLASDPGAPEDFKVLCQAGGHRLMEATTAEGVHRFLILRG